MLSRIMPNVRSVFILGVSHVVFYFCMHELYFGRASQSKILTKSKYSTVTIHACVSVAETNL